MTTLERAATEFLERGLGGEAIDRLSDRPELHGLQQADFLLANRGIVIELKSFTDDRTKAAQGVLDKWRREPDWPLLAGRFGLAALMKRYPRGNEVIREFVAAITKAAVAAFEQGNRQIRDTKQFFGFPDAMGVIVFLNEGVDFLDPNLLGRMFSDQLRKSRPDGSRRFESVDSAILISWAHLIADEVGIERMPVMWGSAEKLSPEQQAASFEAYFIREWASFIQRPLKDAGELRTWQELDALRVRARRPGTVLDADRLPPER